VDSLLVKAGSGVATLGLPDSPGVPRGFSDTTITAPFNDAERVEALFKEKGDSIAAVIVEPVCGNMGCVLPKPGFLESLREITARSGALLIFDEVMTGFRLALGGAQEIFQIKPDLTTFGKVIGGGLPIAAYGGRKDVMTYVAPSGPIYQAGTLSGNPLAVAGGLAMLKYLKDHPEVFRQLDGFTARLAEITPPGVVCNRSGSMLTWFFTGDPVDDFTSAQRSSRERFARFFHFLLDHGIYLPPSQFESLFVSAAHTVDDLNLTLKVVQHAFQLS
jgi:glutamate-1-semialdehyde 2,1-aminomutase